ncbi:MAG TPA: DUF3040 domain-containing protein [Micromonosporaceae bacterium]
MLSKEDQRRFEEITRHLRATDPDFVARVGDRPWTRRTRLLVLVTLLLWAAVPPLAVVGGWFSVVVIVAALVAGGTVLRTVHRRW